MVRFDIWRGAIRAMKYGILTSFSDISPQHSVNGVVLDLARMIHNAGHTAVLFVLRDFDVEKHRSQFPCSTEVRAVLPVFTKVDYQSAAEISAEHRAVAKEAEAALTPHLGDLEVMLAHDILFLGANLPLNLAVQNLRALAPHLNWLHWVHVVRRGAYRDFRRLPEGHALVYPNETDRSRCAEHFRVSPDRVHVIPHAKDPREFLLTTPYVKDLVTRKAVLAADFVQTLPAATKHLANKGIHEIFQVFANLKTQGSSVRLIVCNSWCDSDARRESVTALEASAREVGLEPRSEVIFTSVDNPQMEMGASRAEVRDLMTISNLFVFPSKSETFGLVVAEAALAGQLLVLNSSLPCQMEIAGAENALYFPFGSIDQPAAPGDRATWYADVARAIRHRFSSDPAIQAKTHFRQTYCYEKIWDRIVRAIAAERKRSSSTAILY
jgi:glycosyltransferase involved in cell wall biosynthesis